MLCIPMHWCVCHHECCALQVAFSVVRFTTASGERRGVATSWLEQYARQLAAGEAPAGSAAPRVPVFLRRGGAFGLPPSLSPMLMIGPGTGVAPFRGFLQHRYVGY
jgi:sulfite reductase alpha subunit-like flavoprotein